MTKTLDREKLSVYDLTVMMRLDIESLTKVKRSKRDTISSGKDYKRTNNKNRRK